MSFFHPDTAEDRMTQAVAVVCAIPLALVVAGILLAVL